ncbi:hypothetical protein GCM10017714_24840 [Curtobacterium pusillum]|uniref:Uncharacterized protein n=1 Tax=Curtobacterium pusillum TaxID=69373 RepID=A0AAW3T431_9MICO|nr:hypothetical protein [Curtobacterium pusillum]MBA8989440.1 hypothetical protein [Curtobacterium pusillum]NUU15051.1 hypothetical protein [Curtobacterium pusillum]GLK32615.1 hypothetical protein GCM10017610_29000 [Curtobacterium pusillum]
MCATPEPADAVGSPDAPGSADDPGSAGALASADLADLDPEDAFGHPAVADPARDDAVWPDGDEDDIDV